MEFSNDLIGFTVIVGAYSFYQRLRIAQAQQLASAELQTKLVQAQLENLRLQLQPHFLFNTLNTISSVMYEDVRAADAMITQLSDLLRLTLRASRAHEIPLAEELEITRLYLDLMQKRFENKLRGKVFHRSIFEQFARASAYPAAAAGTFPAAWNEGRKQRDGSLHRGASRKWQPDLAGF